MILEVKGVTKTFPGVVALENVDFDLKPSEVHVLFGENGAGKSTLTSILAGFSRPDRGSLVVEGREISQLTPFLAREYKIAAVFQEFSLIPSLSVLDNIFLGREKTRLGRIDRKGMADEVRPLLQELNFDIPLSSIVGELSRAHMQMVEIAKALLVNARILILDEPTASLTDSEANNLLGIVDRLRTKGTGIVYVSHRLREIRALADRITVLRGGTVVGTIKGSEATETTLVEMMSGRKIGALFPPIDHRPGKSILEIKNLSLQDKPVDGIDLEVRAGEAIGIAGLVGCGKSEVGRAIFGLEAIASGTATLHGEHFKPKSPRQMLRRRLCYFPSDRNAEGLATDRSVLENVSMPALDTRAFSTPLGRLRIEHEKKAVFDAMQQLALRPLDIFTPVAALSGGNRQKVMLGRGLLRDFDVYIFDEPTVGIDVGAKVEVYEFIAKLVASRAGVVIISSELSEVIALSNRVYVMNNGRIVKHLEKDRLSEEEILHAFFQKNPSEEKDRANA